MEILITHKLAQVNLIGSDLPLAEKSNTQIEWGRKVSDLGVLNTLYYWKYLTVLYFLRPKISE